jgi:uncharacterized membrane protein HdeD (DUF308 family)
MLSAWILVDGVFSLASAISERSWFLALAGAVSIAVGWLLFTRPAGAALALFVLIAAWAVARGVAEVSYAVALPKGAAGRGGIAAMGVLSCLFGILLIVAPFAGALAVSAWIGIYALLFGIMELAIAFQLFRARRRISKASGELHEGAAWHQRPKHA